MIGERCALSESGGQRRTERGNKRENKQLPSFLEWLDIRLYAPHDRWSERERQMMHAATRRPNVAAIWPSELMAPRPKMMRPVVAKPHVATVMTPAPGRLARRYATG